MTAAKHFNKEPWFVLDANADGQTPHYVRFASKEETISYATAAAFHGAKTYHVFQAVRVASVEPQQPKICDCLANDY